MLALRDVCYVAVDMCLGLDLLGELTFNPEGAMLASLALMDRRRSHHALDGRQLDLFIRVDLYQLVGLHLV